MIRHIKTSIKEINEKKKTQEELLRDNAELKQSVTDLQLALVEVYETLIETTAGGEG
ncbi:MAG: hypothetical protein ACOX8S_11205 [Christensenellales bacterium]|jgi:hypothetical protein